MDPDLQGKIFIKKYVPSAIVRFEKIRRSLEDSMLSLDAGCSIGILTSEIAQKSKKVVGLEIRKDAIKIAKKIAPKNCFFVVGDATKMPFKDSVFDQAVSSEVIEHIKEHRKYLFEISRATKKGSNFLLTTPNRVINSPSIGSIPSPSISWFMGKLTRNPFFLYPYGHYYGGFSPQRLGKELFKAGFKTEKVDYCGFSLVKLIDDIAYIFAVKKKTYDDTAWFNRPLKKEIEAYKKFLPVIKKLIKIDSYFLRLGLEGYIIFSKSRKL